MAYGFFVFRFIAWDPVVRRAFYAQLKALNYSWIRFIGISDGNYNRAVWVFFED